MRIDLTPYRRSTIGFDRLFDLLEANSRANSAENYPPFNLERLAEDRYRITLAVAGFSRDEIEITAQQNMLLVTGKKDDKAARPTSCMSASPIARSSGASSWRTSCSSRMRA